MTPEEFKTARKGIGQEQEELADALGISRQSVNMMESGKRGVSKVTKQKLLPMIDNHIRELRKIMRKLKNSC